MTSKKFEVVTYVIKPNDTIKSIADLFQTTPKELIKLNGNCPLIIKAQNSIKVPLLPQSNQHFVRSDETIQDLLIRFKLSPNELLSLNDDIKLAPGQIIRLKD